MARLTSTPDGQKEPPLYEVDVENRESMEVR